MYWDYFLLKKNPFWPISGVEISKWDFEFCRLQQTIKVFSQFLVLKPFLLKQSMPHLVKLKKKIKETETPP